MAVVHFKTGGGMALFIIFIIIATIIACIMSNNKLEETLDICAKQGINSGACRNSENKNGISCTQNGFYIECKEK